MSGFRKEKEKAVTLWGYHFSQTDCFYGIGMQHPHDVETVSSALTEKLADHVLRMISMFPSHGDTDVVMTASGHHKLTFTMDLVTVLLSIVVILFLANAFKNQKQGNHKNFPPGPTPLPIIGNILTTDMSKPYKTFMELSKTYGPIFSVQIGMTKSVVLCGYETVKDALNAHGDVFADRPFSPMIAKLVNNDGVVFSNGENWKVMRRFALSTLRDYGMGKRTIEDKIIEEAGCLVQKLKSYGGGVTESLSADTELDMPAILN
ncbi:unnamed protein product [Ranitomeya imitator]|uniref:Uncharacterized protein n=1 Tax=Ranitomeya imitator TaxID=111125 RepID=A0ABN9L715_9NEOB|nr:unnamed protein product [Ranitomeya imitator]